MSRENETQAQERTARNNPSARPYMCVAANMAPSCDLACLLLLLLLRRRRRRRYAFPRRNKKRFWIRDIYKQRQAQGHFNNLVKEMKTSDREMYFRYLRMSPERFEHLLSLVGPRISKQNTSMRECISAAERLTLTLRFLASGDSQQSVAFNFRIASPTVSHIIRETCAAIWNSLAEQYLKPPHTSADWKNISNGFEELWNLPHCVGAIDGKHINMKCPNNSGSLYYNYKGFFSLVLMAICDAHYIFTLVDIGEYGSNNDSGVLSHSQMGKALDKGSMSFPQAEKLSGCPISQLPYFLVGDEAFGLKSWLQRPYPGKHLTEEKRIFNYRLSRARRVIENAFGILRARWGIFRGPIQGSVETVECIIQATVCLHNYLRQTETALYCPSGFVDCYDNSGNIKPGEWRSAVSKEQEGALRQIPKVRGHRYTDNSLEVREALTKYVNSDQAAVPWQWEYVRSTGPAVEE